jgi:hypothetical protein
MSPDVEYMEQRAAQNSYASMMGEASRNRLDLALKFAEWYDDATRCVEENNLPGAPRTLQEHLVNFFMTVDWLIRVEESHV